MEKHVLDLSKPDCHVCGNPLFRDVSAEKDKCIHYGCSAKNVIFSIPYVVEQSKV